MFSGNTTKQFTWFDPWKLCCIFGNYKGTFASLCCIFTSAIEGNNIPCVSSRPKNPVGTVYRIFPGVFTINAMPTFIEYVDAINPDSVKVLKNCKLEPSLGNAEPGTRVQFERLGYYCADTVDSKPGKPVFNRTVTLRDSWAKIEKKQGKKK